jgi:hypothetical protein
MSMYTRYDYEESLDRVDIQPDSVDKVLAAWGESPMEWASWQGGFLLRLKDGRYAYVSGWCDRSGWGCQDYVSILYFSEQPSIETLPYSKDNDEFPPGELWDLEPADLNLWHAGGCRQGNLFE